MDRRKLLAIVDVVTELAELSGDSPVSILEGLAIFMPRLFPGGKLTEADGREILRVVDVLLESAELA